jgi:hypothetical protein
LRASLAGLAAAAGLVGVCTPSGLGEPSAPAAPLPVVADAATRPVLAAPVHVAVPAVGIDSGLERLGLDTTGALLPPADFGSAGWYAQGPVPGEVGPAVIAGHVDSRSGPAVFFRLREVVVGDQVEVIRADGTVGRFTVTRVARYPKTAFPTEQVYGPTPDAELRLITCGGRFDRAARSYTDDVVVFAALSGG